MDPLETAVDSALGARDLGVLVDAVPQDTYLHDLWDDIEGLFLFQDAVAHDPTWGPRDKTLCVATQDVVMPVDGIALIPRMLRMKVRELHLARLAPVRRLSRLVEPQQLVRMLESWGLNAEQRAKREARKSLVQSVTQFVSARIAAKQQPAHPSRLRLRVHTQTTGGRVIVTPAAVFNGGTIFGAPTSPVDGLIDPGIYLFGVAGPTTTTWDRQKHDVSLFHEIHLPL